MSKFSFPKNEPKVSFQETTGDKLTGDQLKRVIELDYELYLQEEDLSAELGLIWNVESFETYIRENKWTKFDNIVLILNEESVIVGFVNWSYREDNQQCHIYGICVDKAYRNKGFGGKLLEHTLEVMDDMYPGESLSLTVHPRTRQT